MNQPIRPLGFQPSQKIDIDDSVVASIKAALAFSNVSMAEIARQTGVSTKTIRRYNRGERRVEVPYTEDDLPAWARSEA